MTCLFELAEEVQEVAHFQKLCQPHSPYYKIGMNLSKIRGRASTNKQTNTWKGNRLSIQNKKNAIALYRSVFTLICAT